MKPLLEGPPGSGKTTVICELILQLAKRGKRVLLCGSTHVAVDNVLERLMEDRGRRDLVIPVRIGDRRRVSEKARPWQLEEFVKTERNRLLGELRRVETLTRSQEMLLDALRPGNTALERMVLDAANLVCGTTIGILQHPDIKKGGKERRIRPEFDVLIVDEASKTPFQEFLVPALWAKRWIVVGDPKQLSPYVDEDAMAVNVEACLPTKVIRDACVDAFLARPPRRHVVLVEAESDEEKRVYTEQCAARGVAIVNMDKAGDGRLPLWAAPVVLGGRDSFLRRIDELPLDLAVVRCTGGEPPPLRRRTDGWLHVSDRTEGETREWAREIGWRLARLYEQRFVESVSRAGAERSTAQRLGDAIDDLLPVRETGADTDLVWRDLNNVRRIALPSVLESLRHGFERGPRQRVGTALSDGLPQYVLEKRHVLLRTQHRMHPDIAEFSHRRIYEEKALETPGYMAAERRWEYSRYHRRVIWIDVQGRFQDGRNEDEARRIVEELRHFDKWARSNLKEGRFPWEVAILSFYRGQEREIRENLRRWTGQDRAMRHFRCGVKECPHISIELCTVDRFQGHEADLVLISFANARSTNFLESPNRLNVALTRARYQRVIVGNRRAMDGRGVLGYLARNEPWERSLERGVGR